MARGIQNNNQIMVVDKRCSRCYGKVPKRMRISDFSNINIINKHLLVDNNLICIKHLIKYSMIIIVNQTPMIGICTVLCLTNSKLELY